MSTIRIKGWVYAEVDRHGIRGEQGGIVCHVLPYKSQDAIWGACVGEIDVPYTLPEGFNVEDACLRARITELQAEKEEAGRDFAEKVARINRQLSELQAIPMAEAA